MKSAYGRQFSMMAAIILISFTLLGAAFLTLTYQYAIREKQEAMERNVDLISEFTGALQTSGGSVRDPSYQAYVSSIARVSDAYVIICEPNGRVMLASEGAFRKGVAIPAVPRGICEAVQKDGEYTGLTGFDGIFPERRYVAGKPVVKQNFWGQRYQTNLVFVAADSSNITNLWRTVTGIFFFTALVVLFIAFVGSSVTSMHQTRPLKEIADMARKFGHGEYDARVTGYEERKDEVGELAEAFNAMADSISKADAKRSEFVANVSHELKTPMTTIAGFAEGILDGTIPHEREEEYLRVISAETRRLSRLVRQMLDLSRMQSAESVIAQEQFDVAEVMLRVLVSLEPKVNGRHLDVATELPEHPVMVWGDPDGITQVCYNLLDNAIKFATEGSTLGIGVTTKAGKAHISVRNEGRTIPADELPLLFDRFHKSDRSRSEDRDGVGLGLYIVKTILGSHKENINVTSENGVTEFTFTLTLA